MLSYNCLLAMVLLSSAPGTKVSPEIQAQFANLRTPLQTLAIQSEILDPRELRYILARKDDFVSDLNLLRRRQRDLSFAPAVSDCTRFPERAIVSDLLAFNRAYRQHVDVRQPVELLHWWELRVALQETDRLYQIWDTVRDARCDYYYITVRRQALKRLKEMVGDDAYYAGNLPPCVPLWRFQKLN